MTTTAGDTPTRLTDEQIDSHYPKMQHQPDECQMCAEICAQAKLANPGAGEVVAWRWHWIGGDEPDVWCYTEDEPIRNRHLIFSQPLYAHPAQAAAMPDEPKTLTMRIANGNHSVVFQSDYDVLRTRCLAQAEQLAELRARVAELEADAERWKERAEYEYGLRIYPDKIGLAVGALDAHMKNWEWLNKQADIDAALEKE